MIVTETETRSAIETAVIEIEIAGIVGEEEETAMTAMTERGIDTEAGETAVALAVVLARARAQDLLTVASLAEAEVLLETVLQDALVGRRGLGRVPDPDPLQTNKRPCLLQRWIPTPR